MKIFYKILLVILIILSFFIFKNEIVKKSLIKFNEKNETQLKGKVDLPGALRVVDNLLNNSNKIILSKDKIILLTNKYRKENNGLKELSENTELDLSAEKKLQDMFDKQYFEHISPKGEGVADLSEQVGYQYILIGENLAMGNFNDDLSLVNAWMESEGHRANILNENYTEIGVAVGKGTFEGKNIWMAVQHFGTPTSVCPSVDQVLLGVINFNQNTIKGIEDDLIFRLDMINKGILYEGSTLREQIDNYNILVNNFNYLIRDIKEKINNYNNQIRIFNSCVLSHQ